MAREVVQAHALCCGRVHARALCPNGEDNMKQVEIMTVPELKDAIQKANEVKAVIRFGCSERWSKITKQAALDLCCGFPNDTTPENAEMYSGSFGSVIDGTLYLG